MAGRRSILIANDATAGSDSDLSLNGIWRWEDVFTVY